MTSRCSLNLLVPAAALALGFAVTLTGCTATPDANNRFAGDTDGAETDPQAGEDSDDDAGDASSGGFDSDDGPDSGTEPIDLDAPHARGIITLGETSSGVSTAVIPYISATFVPDYVEGSEVRCGADIDGCFVAAVPVCAAPCEIGEACTFNDSCQAACEAPCDLACGAGEQCYFPLPGVPGCRAQETFDAGTLSFEGTTVPVTLYPPYVLPPGVVDPLSVPGAEVTVTASGAAGAGFEGFSASMTTAAPLVASLETLSTGEAFGTSAMPLTWVAGIATDDVRVSLNISTATGVGTVQCDAPDTGNFAVPRAAIDAAIGLDEPSSMAVTLERRSSTLTKDFRTKGELVDQTVQRSAWVELISASAASVSVAACPSGQSACGTECISTDYDELNCGECGNVCDAGTTCSLGECGVAGTGGGQASACCVASGTPGCVDAAVQACVCAVDSYCCSTAWDSSCAGYVTSAGCGTC